MKDSHRKLMVAKIFKEVVRSTSFLSSKYAIPMTLS
jgi:hypothetical protein